MSDDLKPVNKTEEEWKKTLTPEQFNVTRQKGTERPFMNKFYKLKDHGMYACVCCGLDLFDSEAKYDSGSGWPSYWEPTKEENIGMATDETGGMARQEIVCKRCQSHLGHVFDDGPKPTGKRYCINSTSLKFKPL